MNPRPLRTFALLALALHLPTTQAALAPGDTAPPFEAPASLAGKTFTYSLADALKRGPVVVYFYPSAYTGGCNLEAHTFAVQHAQFRAAGATIVGVSLDDVGRLNSFSADPAYCGGKIAVAVTHEGHDTVIRITDQGAGLSPEDLGRLFGRFQRLSAKPTAGESSTGLGLSIVKRIIDMHGGHVTAESAGPGQGSTFTVTMPATETT